MFDEIIVIGEVAAKQTEEYDKHFATAPLLAVLFLPCSWSVPVSCPVHFRLFPCLAPVGTGAGRGMPAAWNPPVLRFGREQSGIRAHPVPSFCLSNNVLFPCHLPYSFHASFFLRPFQSELNLN